MSKKEETAKKKLILAEVLSKTDQFKELVVDSSFCKKHWKIILSQMKELGDSLTQQLFLGTSDKESRCWREYCLKRLD